MIEFVNHIFSHLINSLPITRLLVVIGIMVVASIIILMFVLLYEGLATYAERKVAGDIQARIGPNRVGPYGLLQFVADGVKLILKEDIIPFYADKWLFVIAPYIVFTSSFAAFVPLSYSSHVYVADMNVGILYILAISSVVSMAILMGSWGSNNKWSLIGGMRAVAQIVSYEIPTVLSLLAAIIITGTMSMRGIIEYQSGGLGIFRWILFNNPFVFLAFFIYFISSIAEVNRTPFDIPEAESELVAGYHTEYTGMRFAFYFMAEYGDMFIVSAIAVTVFLGGWQIPFIAGLHINTWLRQAIEIVVFMIKIFVLIYVMMWIRWTLPRLRVDQLMEMSWKYLTPIAFFNLIGSSVWVALFNGKGIYDIFRGLFIH
ncbi:MAG: NADH-quinone oxidoreductase subunit NuoH [Deltaproteobacteria bacterium]|nr:NADH-quinone oxidoreductase subunit NuoH [Deltaproteobacteria bacterium]MCL5791575.1 NADH-quinone oxidoreductase subunit NuoH [Deltaproteobacteria bacterium]